jgi:ribosomal protein S12 methylthiotransferase
MEPRKVHVVSLGCPKARVDTEVMVALMDKGGYVLTEDPAEADAVVVNTCSFLQSAVKESIDTVLEMARFKDGHPGRKLVVTGCLPSRYGEELVKELPEVDVFLGTSDLHRITDAVNGVLPERSYIRQGYSHLYEDLEGERTVTTRGATAFLKLGEGCNRTCTFCIIPAIRGRQRSRPIPVVVEEAKRLAEQGIREVVLVAQDLTSYGTDLGDRGSLVKLLRELEGIDGVAWIRLMYAYPWNFTDELLDLIRGSEKVLRYVDMPLQHVSERILTDMRRSVQRDAQMRLLARLREIDGMVLRTTFITGFPGETDEEFAELVNWTKEIQFDRLGVFAYSQEPGTPAGERKDQVPRRVREARRRELLEVQQGIHKAKMAALVGKRFEVLVDGPSEEHGWVMEGRYYGQAPDIDGTVALSIEDPDVVVEPGRFVTATITAHAEYDLVGTVGEVAAE